MFLVGLASYVSINLWWGQRNLERRIETLEKQVQELKNAPPQERASDDR